MPIQGGGPLTFVEILATQSAYASPQVFVTHESSLFHHGLSEKQSQPELSFAQAKNKFSKPGALSRATAAVSDATAVGCGDSGGVSYTKALQPVDCRGTLSPGRVRRPRIGTQT